MLVPKSLRTFCPHCNKHTEHSVSIYKAIPKRRALSEGQRRAERRRRGHGNKGRYSKKPITQIKTHAKTTKKGVLVLKCPECGKVQHRSLGQRLKKLELKR